jgi:hypothetical protein
MTWAAMESYYQHTLSGLVADYAAAGYPASNLLDGLEGTLWKSTSTATQYITYDAGSGNTYTCDYFGVQNHNLYTAGATIVLQWSTDNFSGSVNDAFTAYAPTNDKAFVKTFVSLAKRYWRIKITGATVAPYIGWCRWGAKTVLDFLGGSFDPYDEKINANTNVSDGGYLTGVHVKYSERSLPVLFEYASDTLYAKVKAMFDFCGMTSFLVAWEPGEHSTEIWLLRIADGKISAPYAGSGLLRNISFGLVGRKE